MAAKAKDTKVTRAFERLVLGEDRESAKVLEKLREGKRKIKKSWVQGNFAENTQGERVKVNSEEAVGWCALGAIGVDQDTAVSKVPEARALEIALDPGLIRDGVTDVAEFNDDWAQSSGDVVKLYDRAIKYVQKHGVPTVKDINKRLRQIEAEKYADDDRG